MERMIIRHLSGSKANQVEEYPLNHYGELTFGRDDAAIVRYDADRDDLVGRQHARLRRDPNDPAAFYIEDLNSRNGTFLNKRRLTGAARVQPGDSVQFGPGGPEFIFDLEPRPAGAAKATRIAEPAMVSSGGKVAPETRVTGGSPGGGMSSSVPTAPAGAGGVGAGKATVGKATVERMISHTVTETKKAQGRKYAVIGGAAAVVVLMLFGIVIGGSYWYSSRLKDDMASTSNKANQLESEAADLKKKLEDEKANAPMQAAEIHDKYGKAVVWIQGSWQLQNKESKSQIFHQFIPNSLEYLGNLYKQDYGKGPIIPGVGGAIPVYFQVEKRYEPALTDQKSDLSVPIGAGNYTCSGFIVTADGFILTNRHCSAPWTAQYSFPQGYPPGILIGQDGKIAGVGVKPPMDWIPDNTKTVPRQFQGNWEAIQTLTVVLPGTDNPIQASRVQDSPRHDVGMIRISVPGTLPKVELFDNYDSIKKGEGLVIMGYPGSAPVVYTPIRSQNMLNQETKYAIVPDPTVTVTSVGNIVRNSNPNDLANQRYSTAGDSVRYAGGLTYGGNSGGPVFDMRGRVVGIHFAGDGGGGLPGNFSGYAVPIRYGMQLFPGN